MHRYYRNFVTENGGKRSWSLARFPLDALEQVTRILLDERYLRVPRQTFGSFSRFTYTNGYGWIEIRRLQGEDMWNMIEVPDETICLEEFTRLMQVIRDAGVYIATPQTNNELIPPIVATEFDRFKGSMIPGSFPEGVSYNFIEETQIIEQKRALKE